MPFVATRFHRWSKAMNPFGPWLAVLGAVGVLGGGAYFLATMGPKKIPEREIVEGRLALTTEQRRQSDDIGEAERRFQRLIAAEGGGAEARAVLERGIEKQRGLLRANPRAGIEQNVRLERLLAARDTQRAQQAAKQIAELEDAAEAARRAGHGETALEKMRAALELQREIDNSNADARTKNFAREMSLVQSIESAEAEPIAQEFETAMQQARAAVAAERWSEALAAFGRARDAQTRINHDYARTRFTNLPVLNEIEAEIASLNAAGLAAEIDAREKGADAAADLGRAEEAAGLYKAAQDLQGSLNVQFARSRFGSTARLEQLEIKRQTVLAAEMLAAAAALDRGAAEALLKRQVLAAGKKIHGAVKLLANVEKDFPKTRNFDGALKIKLTFLDLRLGELRSLQDQIYERLVPVPDTKDLLMLKTEAPQELYAKIMSGNPSRNAGTMLPVDSVNWNDVQEFCRRASWILGARVRLPTEQEFRVALGDGESPAWTAENAGGHSQEVAKQPPNEGGFCDLTGNVAEWLQSPENGTARAEIAGGSYLEPAAQLKTLRLVSADKNERARHIGFRFVLELALD